MRRARFASFEVITYRSLVVEVAGRLLAGLVAPDGRRRVVGLLVELLVVPVLAWSIHITLRLLVPICQFKLLNLLQLLHILRIENILQPRIICLEEAALLQVLLQLELLVVLLHVHLVLDDVLARTRDQRLRVRQFRIVLRGAG